MEILAVFVCAFISELCACGYTIAVAKNRMWGAVVSSIILEFVNLAIVLLVVDNHAFILPSVAGVALGNMAMMLANDRLSRKSVV